MPDALDGARYLEHLRSSGGLDHELGDSVVLALHPGVRATSARRRLRRVFDRQRPSSSPFAAIDRGGDGSVTVSPLGPGPAVAAMTVELFAALGVRRVLAVGVASGFERTGSVAGRIGNVEVVGSAVSDESVSSRYGECTLASAQLTHLLEQRLGGRSVTAYSTATPFRLDIDDVASTDAAVIDMEAAALFASANALDIEVGLVLVVSDSTSLDGWRPGSPDETTSAVASAGVLCRDLMRQR